MLLLVHILFAQVFFGTTHEFEQKAADHFFKNIIVSKYPDLKVAEFATKTDTTLFFGIVMTCSHWDEETRKRIFSSAPEKQIELEIPESPVTIKKYRKSTNRLKVIVSPKRKVGDSYYVEVMSYRRLRFIDYFIFQFDQDGRIVDVCQKSEII